MRCYLGGLFASKKKGLGPCACCAAAGRGDDAGGRAWPPRGRVARRAAALHLAASVLRLKCIEHRWRDTGLNTVRAMGGFGAGSEGNSLRPQL